MMIHKKSDLSWNPKNKMLITTCREMWDLFNVNDAKGLNVFEVENGIVDMTQTGDSFDR